MLEISKKFTKKIYERYRGGDATEHSFYGDLSTFVEEIAKEVFNKDIKVTPLPKQVKYQKEVIGLPDFVVKNKDGLNVGWMEAKDPDVKLNDLLDSDQIERYKKLPNFIFTNYCEYYFFRNGNMIRHTILFDNTSLKNLTPPRIFNHEDTKRLFEEFLSFSIK